MNVFEFIKKRSWVKKIADNRKTPETNEGTIDVELNDGYVFKNGQNTASFSTVREAGLGTSKNAVNNQSNTATKTTTKTATKTTKPEVKKVAKPKVTKPKAEKVTKPKVTKVVTVKAEFPAVK